MTRNLKTFGLALVAVLALSAAMASTASAISHHFDGTAGDKLSSVALTTQKFESTTAEGKGYECENVTIAKGTITETTATSLSVEPAYSGCKTFGSTPASVTITQEGCEFKFTGVTTTGNPTGGEHANVHIVCPEGKSIITDVTALKIKCTTIYPQEIKHAVRYENETTAGNGKTHIRIKFTAHGILNKTLGPCVEAGVPETHTNGSYTGDITVIAPNGDALDMTP